MNEQLTTLNSWTEWSSPQCSRKNAETLKDDYHPKKYISSNTIIKIIIIKYLYAKIYYI